MTQSEETELFLRYRDSGDPAALAEVFDRVAPKLLLVAAHLSREFSTAEDLVQATFVAAMENAGEFASDQPLLPWLNGILLNRWRQERRRREVRRRHHGGGEPVEALAAPDAEIEGEELVAAVTAAIDQLLPPYRSALSLRLVHGLRAVEIAHTLGLSPGTVRSQLRRGLELLRRRLPRSLVLPSAIVLVSGEGLAAVRERVLRAVPDKCVATASVSTGAFALWKTALVVVGLALLAATVVGSTWELWTGTTGGSRGAITLKGRVRTARRDQQREPPLAAHRRKVVEPPRLRVAGRVVDGPTGAALPGVSARIRRVFAEGERRARADWQDPPPVTADARGRFEVVLSRDGDAALGRFALELTAQPQRTQQSGLDQLQFGGSDRIELGDVRMFPTVLVTGRIVGKDGRPLGRIGVRFDRVQLNPMSAQQHPRAMAGDDGRFRVALERGTWSVDTATPSGASQTMGYRNSVTPAAIDLTGPANTVDVVLVSDPIDASCRIAGHVVDTFGHAVANVRVEFFGTMARLPIGYARTDQDGAFIAFVFKKPAASNGVRARVSRGSWGDEHLVRLSNPDARYRWGTDDARIVVERRAERRVPIVVRIAGEGTLVDEFGISVGATRLPRTEPSRHARGEGTVVAPGAGTYSFRIYPRDPTLFPSLVIPVPEKSTEPIEVDVFRRHEFLVHVADASGAPIAGSKLFLIHASDSSPVDPERETRILAGDVSRESDVAAGTGAFGRQGQVISEGTTDAQGLARLDGPDTPVILAAVGACHSPVVQLAAPGRRIDLVMPRGATVRGTIRPIACVERVRAQGVVLERTGDGISRWPPALGGGSKIAIEADGSFVVRGVPPGTWSLDIGSSASPNSWRLGRVLRKPLFVVRNLDLADGEVRRIDIDLADRMPARLEGRVFSNGVPVRFEPIYFFRIEDGTIGETWNPSTTTDRRGHFVMPDLVPGEYVIWRELRFVWQGKPRYLRWTPIDQPFRLRAGQELQRDFYARLGSARIRFEKPGGKPLANMSVKLSVRRSVRWSEGRRTDAQGVLRLPRFPCGKIEFAVVRGGRRFDPPVIELRGTGNWEEFRISVLGADPRK